MQCSPIKGYYRVKLIILKRYGGIFFLVSLTNNIISLL